MAGFAFIFLHLMGVEGLSLDQRYVRPRGNPDPFLVATFVRPTTLLCSLLRQTSQIRFLCWIYRSKQTMRPELQNPDGFEYPTAGSEPYRQLKG